MSTKFICAGHSSLDVIISMERAFESLLLESKSDQDIWLQLFLLARFGKLRTQVLKYLWKVTNMYVGTIFKNFDVFKFLWKIPIFDSFEILTEDQNIMVQK